MSHVIRNGTMLLALVACASAAHAEIFRVGANVRALNGAAREVVHALETLDTGTRLGEQRSRFFVEGRALHFEVVTTFEDGLVTEERGTMDIRDGYRARAFHKVDRRNGVVVDETRVDFRSGRTEWTLDGVRHEKQFSFAPDTYAGPMLAFALAGVPESAAGHASFEMVTFRPDPRVYTIRVDVVDRGTCDLVRQRTPTTKVRLKADLGSVGNALFKRLIPTHYFWYTRDDAPDFFGFEGQLGHDGPDLVMIPAGSERRDPTGSTIVARQ